MSIDVPRLQPKPPKTQAVLYLLGTDLGLRSDIPLRSLEILKSADLVVFEEARNARQFLKAAGIHRDFCLFSEHEQPETLGAVQKVWKRGGTVSYMSDQGTPGFADPGHQLVKLALSSSVALKVIPGPNSVAAAIAACPFPVDRFIYCGFMPREEEQRRRTLQDYTSLKLPLVLMDTPYRMVALLQSCEQVLKGWKGLLAVEIGNPEELYLYGDFAKLGKRAEKIGKQNFVLVCQPTP